MRLIPVLDIKSGHVVRARAGCRQDYRPILSQLVPSSHPVDVAQAFRDHYHSTELYLADLDAISGAPPAVAVYRSLQSLGFRLWIDAGVRDVASVAPLLQVPLHQIVIGLETVSGPEALTDIVPRIGRERAAFSLDLKDGVPLGNPGRWRQPDPCLIAAEAIAGGIGRIIVLDLARVGGAGGTGTEDICTRLASQYPAVEIVAGGGIRDMSDLQRLQVCGVRAALVASALHDGRLRPEDVTRGIPSEC
jgi:phosphoribosylformimino-5-aminoimidazole carboxamide ribotide isomerase